MAGLSCARVLADHGLEVEVFDKSRGPSGRMSTRRVAEPAVQVDHGAQFFTARDPHFRHHVESWVHDGVAAPWEVSVVRLDAHGVPTGATVPAVPRFVGAPRMSALGRHLARGLRLQTGVRIRQVCELGSRWRLVDEDGGAHDDFDKVVVAVPAPQAVPLLAARPSLQELAVGAEMVPCQALMVAFAAPLRPGWEAAQIDGGPLAWVARDSSKPGRPPGEVWVAHSSPEHAAAHLEEDPETARARLLQAFIQLTGCQQEPTWSTAHRWRFARPADAAPDSPVSALDSGLGVCGDWLGGPRVEAAWCSGRALAGRILGTMTAPGRPATQLSLL
jgi:predicted NAD/FAD-dependent oxidoreductase